MQVAGIRQARKAVGQREAFKVKINSAPGKEFKVYKMKGQAVTQVVDDQNKVYDVEPGDELEYLNERRNEALRQRLLRELKPTNQGADKNWNGIKPLKDDTPNQGVVPKTSKLAPIQRETPKQPVQPPTPQGKDKPGPSPQPGPQPTPQPSGGTGVNPKQQTEMFFKFINDSKSGDRLDFFVNEQQDFKADGKNVSFCKIGRAHV